ncbi:MAG: GTP-binding protein LepA [Flavobacteriaceae bacterium]
MTTYIAQFKAKHKFIETTQQSCFIWRQEGGEVDEPLLKDKIKRESSEHYFRIAAKNPEDINLDDITITVWGIQIF